MESEKQNQQRKLKYTHKHRGQTRGYHREWEEQVKGKKISEYV